MASERRTYPYLPAKAWWTLRNKFHQSIPTHVTPTYLVAVLGGQEKSAKGNVLPGLKAVGLIKEDDGATTTRAKRWRDDTSYPEVCREIRDELYPRELLDEIPGPSIDNEAAKRWFMSMTGCGEQAARKMAALYSLLTEADPSGAEKATARRPKKTKPSGSKTESTTSVAPEKKQPVNKQQDPPPQVRSLEMPEMRLNLEIRIDASVTPKQIDQIFASMAKHLYHREDEER